MMQLAPKRGVLYIAASPHTAWIPLRGDVVLIQRHVVSPGRFPEVYQSIETMSTRAPTCGGLLVYTVKFAPLTQPYDLR